MLRVLGAATKDARAGVILDLTEELDGIGNSTAVQTVATINRGNGQHLIPTATAILSTVINAPVAAFDATIGRTVRQLPSGVSANGLLSSTYRPRISPLYQASGAPGLEVLPPPLTQTFSIPARRTVAGTAKFQAGFVVSSGMLGLVGTSAGAVWESDPAVFGGNFYPRYRLTNGGAIVDGADSGIAPGALVWTLLGLRMVEGRTPRLEWLINGDPVFSLEGDAEMLALQTALPGGYLMGVAAGTPAGSTWQVLGARWKVQEAA